MSNRLALFGCPIFDGEAFQSGRALLIEQGHVTAIVAETEIPAEHVTHRFSGGFLAPGLVDLQVNGGGGVMLNDKPTVAGIRSICEAHLEFGTTAILPTLITSPPALIDRAIQAARTAIAEGVSGCIGLHVEGPHFNMLRKGAHDPNLIRPMLDSDVSRLARANLPSLMTTLAPEIVSSEQISALTRAGVIVSLGHSDCNYEQARRAVDRGASCVTHLFNAMSGLGNRQPGLVGAALEDGRLFAGLIADGHHVDPATMSIALRAKGGPGRIFLISDAMSLVGTALTEFRLDGRLIRRDNGKLTLEDGTLAGADIALIDAVRFVVGKMGLDKADALRMASLYPAMAIGRSHEIGRLGPGTRADLIHLTDRLEVQSVWQSGRQHTLRQASFAH